MVFKSEQLFRQINIKPDDVKRVQAVIQFKIFEQRTGKGEPQVWTLDLRKDQGQLIQGDVLTPDATFITNDDNMVQIFQSQQPIYQAFFRDKIKVEGEYIESFIMFSYQYAVKFPTSLYPGRRAKL